jgi:hypothetical protein
LSAGAGTGPQGGQAGAGAGAHVGAWPVTWAPRHPRSPPPRLTHLTPPHSQGTEKMQTVGGVCVAKPTDPREEEERLPDALPGATHSSLSSLLCVYYRCAHCRLLKRVPDFAKSPQLLNSNSWLSKLTLGAIAPVCNPSNSGGWGRRMGSSRPTWAI